VELIAPSLARAFNRKSWLGDKVKHAIEPRASFRHVSGVQDFNKLIRFDETELLSNTTEAEFSLTNRIFAKKGETVSEVFSWQLWQRRYFDPDFGGAVLPGRRNVVLSSVQLTPFTFLDGPRRYSPVVSVLRTQPQPGFGIEWRSDYDPLRGHMVDSSFTADWHLAKYFIAASHNHVRSSPLLSPNANQVSGRIGFGNQTSRGWNAAFTAVYDYRAGIMQFATTQVTYNTDCCGLSVQYRRFSFGSRNENQFRVAFAVANIGSFGTLKKQERLF
jgi:LPS-assembly protein